MWVVGGAAVAVKPAHFAAAAAIRMRQNKVPFFQEGRKKARKKSWIIMK
ncbi:MAG: hypothetical protein K5930_13285 [Treponemataceae bacterium]|nr:hypothetical protein [Treponemataceae bacterium]